MPQVNICVSHGNRRNVVFNSPKPLLTIRQGKWHPSIKKYTPTVQCINSHDTFQERFTVRSFIGVHPFIVSHNEVFVKLYHSVNLIERRLTTKRREHTRLKQRYHPLFLGGCLDSLGIDICYITTEVFLNLFGHF